MKRKYEKSILDAATKVTMKQSWKAINDITRFKPKKNASLDIILSSAKDPVKTLNDANDYFTSVGRKLAQNIVSRRALTQTIILYLHTHSIYLSMILN